MLKVAQEKLGQHSIQLTIFPDEQLTCGVHGTFFPNYKESIHRWYPYIEGFSSGFAQALINEFGYAGCKVYDPFGGTGTTVTTAAANGMLGLYSEINPFMRLVIECKTNGLRNVAQKRKELYGYFDKVERYARTHLPTIDEAYSELKQVFGERTYFSGSRLVEIIAIKQAITARDSTYPELRDLTRLALGAIAVSCSEMKRSADLRYRTPKEKLPESFSVLDTFREKLLQIYSDIDESQAELPQVTSLEKSALVESPFRDHVDLIITSPPYLNGTNYFRNTKLELWLSGFLSSEKDLGLFRTQALAAGINNISRRGRQPIKLAEVEVIASQLDKVAYDQRIPELVRRYFSDSCLWLQNAYNLLKPGCMAIIDIGDSRFAGVHVPTHKILSLIAQRNGFLLVGERLVRNRTSKDGMALTQVLLILKKPSRSNVSTSIA